MNEQIKIINGRYYHNFCGEQMNITTRLIDTHRQTIYECHHCRFKIIETRYIGGKNENINN
jgi:predicted SprT family Zn-dependent metalloprotease